MQGSRNIKNFAKVEKRGIFVHILQNKWHKALDRRIGKRGNALRHHSEKSLLTFISPINTLIIAVSLNLTENKQQNQISILIFKPQ